MVIVDTCPNWILVWTSKLDSSLENAAIQNVAAVQSWHYEINLKVLETEGEVLTDRSTNKQKSNRGQINPLRTKEPMKNIGSFHTFSASPVLVGQKISKPREIGRAYYSRP